MTIDGVRRRIALLLVLLPTLFLALPAALGAVPADAVGPLALAAALTAGLVVVLAAAGVELRLNPESEPAWARMLSLRDRAEHTTFLRLRDPDAKGRTRPRAPTAAPAAA